MIDTTIKKAFLNAIKKHKVYVKIIPSRNGMNRKMTFYYDTKNGLENIPSSFFANLKLGKKIDFSTIKVDGCGMNMVWHTLYQACKALTPKSYQNYNLDCSYYKIL